MTMAKPKREEEIYHEEDESPGQDFEEPGGEWNPPEEKPGKVLRTPKEQPPGNPIGMEQPFHVGKEGERPVSLVKPNEAEKFRHRWNEIQTHFVDEPRNSVKAADALVSDVIKTLTEIFASERSGLERQWTRGGDVSTEDLRLAMQRYRSFFDRLLSQ
jgi:hypothetical protein